MGRTLRRLMGMLTPWWRDDEAARRDESTEGVLARSDEARKRADRSQRMADDLVRDYQEADRRLGKMNGR